MNSFSLKIANWHFVPGLTSSLITLILFPLFIYCGLWQYHRAREKHHLMEQLENSIQTTPLVFEKRLYSEKDLSTLLFKNIKIMGHFINEKQILLDNQTYQGQKGYRVITPFQPYNDDHILLIDRGFYPVGLDRSCLPLIQSILRETTITGILTRPSKGILLKESAWGHFQNSKTLVIQHIDFEKLSQTLQQKILPFLLQLNQNNPYGYTMTPISFGLSEHRHLGYALQWFTMALAVVIYFGVINCHRLKKDHEK